MKLFGFEIKRKNDDEEKLQTLAPDIQDDGAVFVTASPFSSSAFVDMDGTLRNEADLVNKYRDMAQYPEIDIAIKNIVNEAIVMDNIQKTVEIDLESMPDLPPRLKELITQEFDRVLDILQFNRHGYETFKRWYIDGREYFHVIVDNDPRLQKINGIREIRYLDPRKIRKIKVVKPKAKSQIQQPVQPSVSDTRTEYYIYNEKGFNQKNPMGMAGQGAVSGIKIAKDSIIHITSGLTNATETQVLSYLHKAIKPMNCLKSLEDASIIHSMSRAPQRRVFHVEIGNLPKIKGEQYLADMMVRHKNRLEYDQTSGEIRDGRKMMTMNEDYWFTTRNGVGHKIETLEPGPNLGEMSNIDYFQDKVFRALDVPIGRLSKEAGGGFDMGKSTEISRDELNFQKFIDRIRQKFSDLFTQALEKQLLLKQIITPEDWDLISNKIKYKYARDNHFTELKDREILTERMALLAMIQPYIGIFYSEAWVMKNVLMLSEEDIEKMEMEMNSEINSRLAQQRQAEAEMNAPQ